MFWKLIIPCCCNKYESYSPYKSVNDLGLPQNKNLLCDLNENFEDFVDGGNTCFPINIQMNEI